MQSVNERRKLTKIRSAEIWKCDEEDMDEGMDLLTEELPISRVMFWIREGAMATIIQWLS